MSGGELMILGKLVLTLGGLLGFAVWELLALRRDRIRRDSAASTESSRRSG